MENQEQVNPPIDPADDFYTALAKAQSEYQKIEQNRTGREGNREYRYAPLDEVLAKTLPALNRHGFAVTWDLKKEGDFGVSVICRISRKGPNSDPDTIECECPLYFEATMKALGSAMTYGRRYSYQMAAGCIAEVDDDGTAAGSPPKATRGPQRPDTPPRRESRPEPAPAPATPAPAPAEKPAKPTPPTYGFWQDIINRANTPEALKAFIEKAVAGDTLPGDPVMFKRVIEYAAHQLECRISAGDWKESECEVLDGRIADIWAGIDRQLKAAAENEAYRKEKEAATAPVAE